MAAFGNFDVAAKTKFNRFVTTIERTPRLVLATFMAIHVAFWSIIPALFQHNLPLDVIEQLAWGREWQWAYFKHPPLPAWILEIVAVLTNGSDRALFFVGPLASALALLMIWRLAVDIVGLRAALFVVLVQEGILYFTFFTPEFNHNVIQLPLWALIGWTAHRAFVVGRTGNWLATGTSAGLGMLGKYSTALLLLALALFICIDPSARKLLKTPGPWLGLATMILILTPHILALGVVDYAPIYFPFERVQTATHWFDHILFPLKFAGTQFLDILPALLLLMALRVSMHSNSGGTLTTTPFDRRFVAILCWAPFLISVIISGVTGLKFKDMWGAPFWDYVGLFAIVFLIHRAPRLSGAFATLWTAIFLLGPLAYAAQFPGQMLSGHKPLRGQFPGRLLAQTIDEGWHRVEGNAPLRYVVGDVWITGNVAFALWRERPSVMIDGDLTKSPWINRADLACKGAVLMWEGTAEGNALLARFPKTQQQPEIDLPYQTWNSVVLAKIHWAILQPDTNCNADICCAVNKRIIQNALALH